MIPIPVMQFINFFYSTVIDNLNILKINVGLRHPFTAHFENILHIMYTHNFDIDYLHLQSYCDYDLTSRMSGNILSRD